MSEIHVKEGESLDSALKRFKRSCAKAGIVAEVRKRECYESPSVKRRKKSEAARKNRNKRYYYLAQKKTCHSCGGSFLHPFPKGCLDFPARAREGERRARRGTKGGILFPKRIPPLNPPEKGEGRAPRPPTLTVCSLNGCTRCAM